jgi:1-acyl-sn-glycerol-3-phosphate acyltransferase
MTIPTRASSKNTPTFIYLVFWLLVWLHVGRGVITLLVLFPLLSTSSKNNYIQRWSKRLLEIFGIELQVNQANLLPQSSYLLACNHVSWLDIHAVNAFKPIRFVAKSEVASWPIFGWMAKQLGTVFIRRDSSKNARQVVDDMAAILKTQSICIFPEGTSTVGKSVQTFKPNLFEAAAISEVPVCALALAYFDRSTGQHSEVPAFIGDMGLIESMAKILKNRRLRVEVTIFTPVKATPDLSIDRKALALQSQEQIAQYLARNCN